MTDSFENADDVESEEITTKPSFASGFGACLNIFLAPKDATGKVGRGLSLWPGLIVLVLAAIIIAHFNIPFDLELARIQAESGAGFDSEVAEKIDSIVIISAYIKALLLIPFIVLVVSFVYWLTYLLTFGSAPFGRVFALTVYCGLITLLGYGLNVLYLRMTNPEFSNAREFGDAALDLSLSAFISDSGTFLGGFLSQLGIFPLWYLAVFVMGMASVLKRSPRSVLAPSLAVFLLWAVLVAIAAKVFAGFGA